MLLLFTLSLVVGFESGLKSRKSVLLPACGGRVVAGDASAADDADGQARNRRVRCVGHSPTPTHASGESRRVGRGPSA